jgi:hypothetical protein
MKPIILLLELALFFTYGSVFGDVIPDNSHWAAKCVKITDLDKYPGISLIGYVECMAACEDHYCYRITDEECLDKGYKFNSFSIYAVTNSYLAGKDIDNLNFPEDNHALQASLQIDPEGTYIDNSIHIDSIFQYYKIIGFTENAVVLFKWKEITGYNDDTPDLTQVFDWKNDSAALSQQFPEIPAKTDPVLPEQGIRLFPNPNQGDMILQMENNYIGRVEIDFFTVDGRIAKSVPYVKTGFNARFSIPTGDMASGNYVVRLHYGGFVQSQKIIVH